jgi:AraC-like DNA-binding protein
VRSADGSDASELQNLVGRVAREVFAERPGTTAVVTRLTEVLFVEMLRTYAATHPARAVGWAGFADAWVGPALERIHEDPGADWSVAALARAAGLSRTAFALRFRRLMGTTPLAYVVKWRLTTAQSKLRDPSISIADVAGRVGYRSESAFNRAFTKAFGMGPGAYRRQPQDVRLTSRSRSDRSRSARSAARR